MFLVWSIQSKKSLNWPIKLELSWWWMVLNLRLIWRSMSRTWMWTSLPFQVTRWLVRLVSVFFTVKEKYLEQMSPVEFGGEMIDFVYEQSASWKELPWKFEAGTPNMAGAIGLAAAVDYLEKDWHGCHWSSWTRIDCVRLSKIAGDWGLTIYGSQGLAQRSGVIAFNLGDLHPHDLATALDYEGVAVRAGHHCAQPLLPVFGCSSNSSRKFLYLQYQGRLRQASRCLTKDKGVFQWHFLN